MDRIPPGTTPPTAPAYLTRAYAPVPQAPAARQSISRDGTIARIGPDSFQPSATASASASRSGAASPSAPASKASSLVAARVARPVDFSSADAPSAPSPQTAAQTIPLYRHPADRNTVATAVHAGRILDVNG